MGCCIDLVTIYKKSIPAEWLSKLSRFKGPLEWLPLKIKGCTFEGIWQVIISTNRGSAFPAHKTGPQNQWGVWDWHFCFDIWICPAPSSPKAASVQAAAAALHLSLGQPNFAVLSDLVLSPWPLMNGLLLLFCFFFHWRVAITWKSWEFSSRIELGNIP